MALAIRCGKNVGTLSVLPTPQEESVRSQEGNGLAAELPSDSPEREHDFSYDCQCRSCREYMTDLLADQTYQDSIER